MSQSNEANDYKILSVETDKKFPENSNIIKFDVNNKVLASDNKVYNFFKRALILPPITFPFSVATL